MKTYTAIIADLDGTLIDTFSEKTFPEGVYDMKINFDVLDKIKELSPKAVLIASNQGGIESGFVDAERFMNKLRYICDCIYEYTGIQAIGMACGSNNKNHPHRKPNTGMVEILVSKAIDLELFESNPKNEYLMIGDASGKEGQFSDSDKKCAENAGIPYMDVKDFLNFNLNKNEV